MAVGVSNFTRGLLRTIKIELITSRMKYAVLAMEDSFKVEICDSLVHDPRSDAPRCILMWITAEKTIPWLNKALGNKEVNTLVHKPVFLL